MATFRFYGDLNDFLPIEKRDVDFAYPFTEPQSVKHLIEAAGVPHPEVELILVNGLPVDFGYMVQEGDAVAVYPLSLLPERMPQMEASLLRPSLPRPACFILDIHLGQLARYLRLLGFDTLYPDHHHDDGELAQLAAADNRILLTRDRGLLKRSMVTYGYCLRTPDPREQLTAVLTRYDLFDDIQQTPRCLRCNGELRPVPKADIEHRLEPKTKAFYDEFHMCQACSQIYWQGSHYDQIQQFIQQVQQEVAARRARKNAHSEAVGGAQ
ncbi:MAG: Mut7-C ubiquitin/RNAse domain-containing protein [Anaerolineales bacterium]|nr:Mut7-C ubiquitin/RNAse domain-containing protein [Anaerolineales bacterium]